MATELDNDKEIEDPKVKKTRHDLKNCTFAIREIEESLKIRSSPKQEKLLLEMLQHAEILKAKLENFKKKERD